MRATATIEETQTRPIYSGMPDRTTVVHETAHRHSSADIRQFVALAEEVSGQPLGPLSSAGSTSPASPSAAGAQSAG